MRVGILTFHYAINYGAVLQMYSLKKTVEQLGHKVEIINYIPSDFNRAGLKETARKSGLKQKDFSAFKRITLNLKYEKALFNSFDRFLENNFTLSNKTDESNWKALFKEYDCIIVGSDQVWNPTNQRGDVYFLNAGESAQKKIAYAVDTTNDSVQNETIKRLKKAIHEFNAVSVRNAHSKSFVKKITGKDVDIVADPVILNSFEEFCNPKSRNEKYAFVYILGKEINGGHSAVIKNIKAKYGDIKIYQAAMIKQNMFTILDDADNVLYSCTPEEWVNLIYNAEVVYTDSFHCILFSAKFHKPFISYYADKIRAPRLIALKEQYGFGARIVSSVEEMDTLNSLDYKLDYENIDKIFKEQAEYSKKFLIESLKGE